MAIIRFAVAVKNSTLTQIRDAIDAGSGPGTCKIYTGTQPVDVATGLSGNTLLGTLTFADPCGVVSAGALTMSPIIQDSSADAGGVATWARIADSAGVAVMDIDISTTGGGGTLQLNTTNIVIAGPILINTFLIQVA